MKAPLALAASLISTYLAAGHLAVKPHQAGDKVAATPDLADGNKIVGMVRSQTGVFLAVGADGGWDGTLTVVCGRNARTEIMEPLWNGATARYGFDHRGMPSARVTTTGNRVVRLNGKPLTADYLLVRMTPFSLTHFAPSALCRNGRPDAPTAIANMRVVYFSASRPGL